MNSPLWQEFTARSMRFVPRLGYKTNQILANEKKKKNLTTTGLHKYSYINVQKLLIDNGPK